MNGDVALEKTSKITPLLVTIAGVAVALLNIWIVTKLAPLAEGLAVLTNRVEAVERVERDDFQRIDKRLDRIEQKVDALIAK